MKLNALMDNKGARKGIKRVGRGMASGYGKTAGRGHKGQKARSGAKQQATFEGGQTPFFRRLPKIGFKNPFAKKYATINLADIQKAIDAKRIDASAPITIESLMVAKILNRKHDGLKILGRGEIKSAVKITAVAWSKTVEAAIVKAGGSIQK
ncbi:MAG: 50S ribosomal protein L15 [Alphaproteobacteria bacterium]|nr:50S ribosomal protein L15 [Alphaproteobacteria bacterium]MCL2889774.1 50S ribosomal protein L15 [Alphaproteobacteria bacterium]